VTELHVHDWTPAATDDALDSIAQVIRAHGRNAETLVPWDKIGTQREYYRDAARKVWAAAVPHIERAARAAAFTEAADEIHREARWQKESQMRGMFANGEMSIDRLAMLEDIMRTTAAYCVVARGGEATE